MLVFPFQNDFETDCQSLGYDDHTIESYRSNLRLFFEYVQLSPEEITNTNLNEFLRYLRYEKEIIRGTKKKKSVLPNQQSMPISHHSMPTMIISNSAVR